MRTFWGLVFVLVLGSAGYLYGKLMRSEPAPLPAPVEERRAAEPVAAPIVAVVPAPAAPVEPDATTDQNPSADPNLDSASLDAILGTGAKAAMLQPTSPPQEEPKPEESVTAPAMAPAVAPVPAADVAPAQSIDGARQVPVPAAAVPPSVASAENAPPAAPPAAKAATFAGFEVIPATRTVRDDGSLLLDDHYVVSGKGTESDPYKVTWDLLTSSSQTLAPRQGKKSLPERITMFDGQWVELSGYIAFPLMVQEADELLLMLNQWDGCCIGVPPTPYDAIEVSLAKKVKGQDRFAIQGTLKGKLGVKPHLVGEWLVGIYVMDSATLSTKAIGGISQ